MNQQEGRTVLVIAYQGILTKPKMTKKEFTGDYYKCNHCGYVWDYMDSHCPNCGSQDEETLNAEQVRIHYKGIGDPERSRMEEMLKSHGD